MTEHVRVAKCVTRLARLPWLLLALPILLAAAEVRTVEVTAEVSGAGKTPEQARQEALLRARELAVAEVAGIDIAAQQLRLKSEEPGAVRDAFSYLVHTSSQGRIVREQVTYGTRLDDELPVYVATLRADVVLEEGTRDPSFTLELATDPDSRTLRSGEAIVLAVTPSANCYLTVLNLLPDGSVSPLLPNSLQGDRRASQGRVVHIPSDTDGFELRARLPPGMRRSREQVLVVATLDPVRFDAEGSTDDELAPAAEATQGLTRLNRWLLGIPVDRRTELVWDYEVVE